MCPHYDAYNQRCTIFDTYQEEYQKQMYCLSREDWIKCANYEASFKK